MEPIFQTSFFGTKVTIYKDRLIYKQLLKEIAIPINQISSINMGTILDGWIKIETAGGKKYKIVVKASDKKKLQEAIYRVQSSQMPQKELPQKDKSEIDDLEKLAELKEKGIISQEEFEAKKKKILNI